MLGLSLTVFLISLLIVGPARAASIFVNSAADTVADDGACTLREAITAANTDTASGATVGECAAGSSADTITFAADYTITLAGSQLPAVTTEMTITGNGAANTIIQASTCNPVTLPGGCTPATYRVLEVKEGDLTLDGVTVRHGRCGACANFSNVGGGILNDRGFLTVTNSTLSGNSADNGGGIYNLEYSRLTVTNSTLSSNSAGNAGGGIYNLLYARLTVTNSTLSSNSAFYGGGIFNYERLTVTNSTLSGNSASYGGGIYNVGYGSLTVTNSTLSGNSATSDGGGIYNKDNDASLTVTNSTFSGNSAGAQGGGLANDGNATVTNSTFSGNTTGFGAAGSGGVYAFSGKTVDAVNTIFVRGTGANCTGVSATNSLADDSSCSGATQKTAAEIALGPLQDNGGPTQTHALLPGSAAIDFAPSAGCTAAPVGGIDQRSEPRNSDVPGTGSDTTDLCDAGAYEAQFARLTITKDTWPAGGTGFPFVIDQGPYSFDFRWGSLGSAVFQFREPADIAIDAAGNVYVADLSNHRISKFDANGVWIASWGSGPSSGEGAFDLPYSVAVGPDGSVYVADSGNNRIQKFDSAGNFLTKWGANGGDGSSGSGDGQFIDPRGVAVDAEGFVYVSEYDGNRVQKFTSAGVYVSQWGTGGTGGGEFDGPWGLDVTGTGAAGLVVVADSGNNRLQVFESDGTFFNAFGGSGTSEFQYDLPTGVAIDNAGIAIITDANNQRVTKVLLPGAFVSMWGWGVDDGSAVFQNCLGGCQAGISGSGDGQFNFPLGLDVNAQGQVYVADSFNDRVPVFSPDQSAVLDDGQSESFYLEPRDYLVSELVPDGWAVDSVTCDSDFLQPFGPNSAIIAPEAGADVECTFNNLKLSRIIIVKDATPADNTPFTFEENISDPLGDTFVLMDPADNNKLFIDVEPGQYTVKELIPQGWTLAQNGCEEDVDENSEGSEDGTVTINLEEGETVTCTFVNEKEATANICPAGSPYVGTASTLIIGTGMYPNQSVTVAIKDWQQVTGLYAQLAGKKLPKSTYTSARFTPKLGTTTLATIDDNVVDSAEYRDYAVFWYGANLDAYAGDADRVRGQLFVTSGSATNMGRALILYADYGSPRIEYFNYVSIRETDPAARLALSNKNFVYWQTSSNWFQSQTYEVDLGGPLPADWPLQVQTAVVDNDPDKRPFKLVFKLVDDGGNVLASKTVQPTGPSNKSMLNINRPLFEAPAGTAKVIITLSSPYKTGDSVALVGAAVTYPCATPVR